jgi:4-hydroxybenzoate polyprenyltransferase
MGYCIFTVPAIFTTVLYHAAAMKLGRLTPVEAVLGCLKLTVSLVACIMSYRGAGLAWDDVADREIDASVSRTKARPLPAGDISLPGALLYVAFQVAVTEAMFRGMLPLEAAAVNIIGWLLFIIYPYFKYFTYWAQIGGAGLIAWVVPVAWIACAATYESEVSPVTFTSAWRHAYELGARDWKTILPIFLIEFIFTFVHETIYGCQDTAEDLKLGVFSTSILFGYRRSKEILTPLLFVFIIITYSSAGNAGLHNIFLALLPSSILLSELFQLNMAEPKSCGRFALKGIMTKYYMAAAFWASLLVKAAFA